LPELSADTRELEGRTLVVTGSSRGIGRAVALRLASAGATLILHGREPSSHLDRVVAEVRTSAPASRAICADFLREAEWQPFVDRCFDEGPLAGWVHVAGADVLTTDLRSQSFLARQDALWQVDVRAATWILHEVGARLSESSQADGDSAIVTIGWDQAETGMAGEAGLVFGTTKAAVHGLTRSLAQSLAPQVRVNCAAPGWIRTAWGAAAGASWQQRATAESLAGRWGTPEDVADAVAFLVSPASRFIHGQVIPVNGGWKQGRAEFTPESDHGTA
jgi:3-oxoacyl-[acyl-carrier protein] reductase